MVLPDTHIMVFFRKHRDITRRDEQGLKKDLPVLRNGIPDHLW